MTLYERYVSNNRNEKTRSFKEALYWIDQWKLLAKDLLDEYIELTDRGFMAPRNNKPTRIAVGNHLIDPEDVSCISKVKNGTLYIVRLKSLPNPEYPIWVKPAQIGTLLEHLNIVGDFEDEDEDY